MTDQTIQRIIYLLSAVVFLAVAILFMLPPAKHIPAFVLVLPKINAFINGTCFMLLLVSLYFIKQKNIQAHKTVNLIAFGLSALFLVSYVVFHYHGIKTSFPANNPLRPVYLIILLTHILLAAIVLPLVLLSFYRGIQNNIPLHKKIVRFSYPIWLYVTLSGVLVYLMISPYYAF